MDLKWNRSSWTLSCSLLGVKAGPNDAKANTNTRSRWIECFSRLQQHIQPHQAFGGCISQTHAVQTNFPPTQRTSIKINIKIPMFQYIQDFKFGFDGSTNLKRDNFSETLEHLFMYLLAAAEVPPGVKVPLVGNHWCRRSKFQLLKENFKKDLWKCKIILLAKTLYALEM